ncbi:MAG: hypothetical protein M3Q07_04350 [Pseudobdellovibrionaceae bacterium]|nr:hypothetical protein [Pseudobdellovibrionaceae bacterium]
MLLSMSGNSINVAGYASNTIGFSKEFDISDCEIMSMTYAGQGRVITVCRGGMITLFSFSSRGFTQVGTFGTGEGIPGKIFYDIHAQILYLSAGDGIWMWPRADFSQEPYKLKVFRSGVGRFEFSEDRKFVALGSVDKEDMTIKVHRTDLFTAAPSVLEGHTSRVYAFAFLGRGTILASSDHEGIVKLWDVQHPDFSGVTLPVENAGPIQSLTGLPNSHEFIVENDIQETFHFKLLTIPAIGKKTCEFLKPYFQSGSGLTETQRELCKAAVF